MAALDFSDVDFSKLLRPVDDGAADHLNRTRLPSISLSATTGNVVDLSTLSGLTIVYIYPKTGVPGVPMPEGWDMIPGARGCSPQSCGFRDHFNELKSLGVNYLFGMSSQTSDYQREAVARLHLPFALLSDERFEFTDALQLPTFEVDGGRLLKRLTLVILDGVVDHIFYPVFPPNESASEVVRWLRSFPSKGRGVRGSDQSVGL